MLSVPSELVDDILDRLAEILLAEYLPVPWGVPHREWSRNIGALGLVGRTWYPRSRYHLFSVVELRPGNIQAFLLLVEKSKCDILAFIRTLHLRFTNRGLGLLNATQLARCDRLDAIWIWALGSIESLKFYSLLESHAVLLGAMVPRLSCLTLTFYDLPLPLPTIAKVVSSFPTLKTLRLFGGEVIPGNTIPLPFPRLRTLCFVVYRTGTEGFFAYLVSLANPPLLEKAILVVTAELHASESCAATYFRKYGGEIQYLELDHVGRRLGTATTITHVALQHTPNLRNLKLQRVVTPLLDFLPAIVSHKLTAIHIDMTEYWDHPSIPWGNIDALLAETRFGALNIFEVKASRQVGWDEEPVLRLDYTGSWEVRAAMPLATARGIMAGPDK